MLVTLASLAWHCKIPSQAKPNDDNESQTVHDRRADA